MPPNNNLVHIKYGTGKTEFRFTGYYENGQWMNQSGKANIFHPNLEWLDENSSSDADVLKMALEEIIKDWTTTNNYQKKVIAEHALTKYNKT